MYLIFDSKNPNNSPDGSSLIIFSERSNLRVGFSSFTKCSFVKNSFSGVEKSIVIFVVAWVLVFPGLIMTCLTEEFSRRFFSANAIEPLSECFSYHPDKLLLG
ncbi:hypothetical protein FJ366_00170 [Candidatus Dependentiae bacterium]|nr:hypothetical protein [Candidatus Dependentiae bacterium]